MSIRLEHVSYAYEDNSSKKNYALKDINLEIKKELVEIAYKLARDKHFQQVLFPEEIEGLTTAFRLQKIAEPFLFTKTTK